MRLIDADELRKCAIPCSIHNGALTDMCVPLYQIDNVPTVPQTIITEFKGCNNCELERSQGTWVFKDLHRHKVCDFCDNPVGVNKRYFKIKSKNYLVGFAGSCSDNRTYHMCEDCMQEFAIYLQSKLKGDEEK